MLPEMADDASAARSALDYLAQLQPGLKGAAVFSAEDRLEAGDGSAAVWVEGGTALLAAIDEAVGGRAEEAHIATAAGEIFVQSRAGRRLVAVAERFVLASLLSFDMRTVLREIGRESDAA